jgi:hypothetical protein
MLPNPTFVQIYAELLLHKIWPENLNYLCNFHKTAQTKQSPNGRKFAQSGVDAMIPFFCDFRQKNCVFSQKTMSWSNFGII